MNAILLTQYGGSILGPIAKVLGWIMNGIFWVLDKSRDSEYWSGNYYFYDRYLSASDAVLPLNSRSFSKLSAKMNPGASGNPEAI